jgi:hypothetical protein
MNIKILARPTFSKESLRSCVFYITLFEPETQIRIRNNLSGSRTDSADLIKCNFRKLRMKKWSYSHSALIAILLLMKSGLVGTSCTLLKISLFFYIVQCRIRIRNLNTKF